IENALLELRRAEAHLVEALEAHTAPPRHTGARELEAKIPDTRFWHLDRRAADPEPVGRVELLELGHDRTGVVLLELAEEDGVGLVRLPVSQVRGEDGCEHRRRDEEHARRAGYPREPAGDALDHRRDRRREYALFWRARHWSSRSPGTRRGACSLWC